jgi:hypothetical protein
MERHGIQPSYFISISQSARVRVKGSAGGAGLAFLFGGLFVKIVFVIPPFYV